MKVSREFRENRTRFPAATVAAHVRSILFGGEGTNRVCNRSWHLGENLEEFKLKFKEV